MHEGSRRFQLVSLAAVLGASLLLGSGGAGAQTAVEVPTSAKLVYRKTTATRGVFKTKLASEHDFCKGGVQDVSGLTVTRRVKIVRLSDDKVIGSSTTDARGIAKLKVRHRAVNNKRFKARVPATPFATYAQLWLCKAATSNRVRP